MRVRTLARRGGYIVAVAAVGVALGVLSTVAASDIDQGTLLATAETPAGSEPPPDDYRWD